MADYSELKRKAQEIRDEVKAGANTANRVGLALEDTVNALEAENMRAEQAEVSLENAIQLLQDETEDLPSIREKLDTFVVNDLTTGGADKALSAEMGKVLGLSVEDLKERIYDLGDFGRSSQAEAEAEAGKADIAGNPGIVLIRYTVDNKNGIILQQVGETITTQILLWDSVQYQRHINFSGSDKTSVSSTSYWYKIGATHTSYDAETRRLHLQDMNYSNLNPSIDAVLPLASEAEAGLMSKEQVAKLREAASNADLVKKQNKLKTYSETSDGKIVNVVSSSSVKMEAKPESNTTYARVLITANDYAVDYTAMVGRSGLGDPTSLSLGYNSIGLRTGGNIEMKSAQGTVYDVVGAIVSRESDGVSLLENGNIKLTLRGTTKEFMPATPSGDPMHYAYIAAGAEWNDTDKIIQKTAPWITEEKWRLEEDGTYTYWEEPAIIDHLPKHWYLNGLGDITNEQMMNIYSNTFQNIYSNDITKFYRNQGDLIKFRTNLRSKAYFAGIGRDNNFYMESCCHNNNSVEVFVLNYSNMVIKAVGAYNAFHLSGSIKHIIGYFRDSNNAILYEKAVNLLSLNCITNKPVGLRDSLYIYKRSILYIIQNTTPTTAITITLHPDAYARIANQPDILEALEAKNAELQGTGGSVSLVSA